METLKKMIVYSELSTFYLIKHSPVSTEEAPLGGLNHCTLVVLNREADVKNLKVENRYLETNFLCFSSYLTPALHISVVSVSLALA